MYEACSGGWTPERLIKCDVGYFTFDALETRSIERAFRLFQHFLLSRVPISISVKE